MTRWRAVAKIQVLPPDVVPMSKEDEQQAIQAIVTMIAQWRRGHGRDGDPPNGVEWIMNASVDEPLRRAHLAPELGKRGSYSATYGPHETRTQTRTA